MASVFTSKTIADGVAGGSPGGFGVRLMGFEILRSGELTLLERVRLRREFGNVGNAGLLRGKLADFVEIDVNSGWPG